MSDKTKFTKGEWSYFDHGVGEIVVHDDNDDCICSLDDSQSGYAWKDGYSVNGQAKANAHLISAAPDMYEALDMVNNAIMDCKSEIELADSVAALSHNLSQALRKARGEL